eukprot:c15716_g1_i2.p1 GENE.c15716_g1_i2~~c15716_g1_i2.p1  ORF type:complete len:175 (-),score=40.62 c15716_g1_i2:7-531(-)
MDKAVDKNKTTIAMLEELLHLRKQRLKRLGHVFPEDDDAFVERLRQESESEREIVSTSPTTTPEAHAAKQQQPSNHSETECSKTQAESTPECCDKASSGDGNPWRGWAVQSHDESADYDKYFMAGNSNLDALIFVRREWDKYIVKPGEGGSRIPQHFLQPPMPMSARWSKYLIP